MDVALEAPTPLVAEERGQIIGSLGFAGKATGVICLNTGLNFAKVITSRMLGIPEAETDDGEMVNDAFGELSNMIVGRVKSRLCDAGWSCTLTIPSIVRGRDLRAEGPAQVSRKVIGFHTGEHRLLVELLLKQS